MRHVRISRQAQEDVVEIEAYVARSAPKTAARLASGIYDRMEKLSFDAHLFGSHPDVPLPLRRVVYKSYEIFFKLSDEAVLVVSVIKGSRDLPRVLRERGLVGYD